MSNQLKDLNSNIQAKDKKIKSIYKTMKRVRVYCAVQVVRIQTGGYVGGIILGGSCTVIQNVAC